MQLTIQICKCGHNVPSCCISLRSGLHRPCLEMQTALAVLRKDLAFIFSLAYSLPMLPSTFWILQSWLSSPYSPLSSLRIMTSNGSIQSLPSSVGHAPFTANNGRVTRLLPTWPMLSFSPKPMMAPKNSYNFNLELSINALRNRALIFSSPMIHTLALGLNSMSKGTLFTTGFNTHGLRPQCSKWPHGILANTDGAF